MGAREGTKPEDDPLMRSQNAKARTEGRAQGHQEGHAQGRREGHAQGRREGLVQGRSEMLAANVLTVLKARDIAVASDLAELRELCGTSSSETLMEAALACTDADDFRRRIGEH